MTAARGKTRLSARHPAGGESTVHCGAHIDALSHVTRGDADEGYNGYAAQDHLGDFGPRRAGGTSPALARLERPANGRDVWTGGRHVSRERLAARTTQVSQGGHHIKTVTTAQRRSA